MSKEVKKYPLFKHELVGAQPMTCSCGWKGRKSHPEQYQEFDDHIANVTKLAEPEPSPKNPEPPPPPGSSPYALHQKVTVNGQTAMCTCGWRAYSQDSLEIQGRDFDNHITNVTESLVESDPEPSLEDLANLSSPDLGSAPEEIRSEKKRKFLDLISKAIASMVGDSLPEDQREIIADGYKEMLSGLIGGGSSGSGQFPVGVTIPAMPTPTPLPQSVFTCIDSEGSLATIDFFCILSRCVMQSTNFSFMDGKPIAEILCEEARSGIFPTTLILSHNQTLRLNIPQTIAFIRYLAQITEYQQAQASRFSGGFPMSIRSGIDDTFLNHPKIREILGTVDAEFVEDDGN